jgi:predicted ATPase
MWPKGEVHVHLKKVSLNPDKYPTRDHYPFNLELFQLTRSITLDIPVTFFVGENGSGKSTLVEAITRKCGIYIWQGIQPVTMPAPMKTLFTRPSASNGPTAAG